MQQTCTFRTGRRDWWLRQRKWGWCDKGLGDASSSNCNMEDMTRLDPPGVPKERFIPMKAERHLPPLSLVISGKAWMPSMGGGGIPGFGHLPLNLTVLLWAPATLLPCVLVSHDPITSGAPTCSIDLVALYTNGDREEACWMRSGIS